MKSKIAIVNASPLIALACLEKEYLLKELFKDFIVPESVAKEVTKPGKPYSERLTQFIKHKILNSKNRELIDLFAINLDAGESEVLALYYEVERAIVVIDEEEARKLAKRKEIPFIGTLGILVLAKYKGLVTEVKELMDVLVAKGIRISPQIYKEILTLCKE